MLRHIFYAIKVQNRGCIFTKVKNRHPIFSDSSILSGKITRNSQIRVVRDGIVICEDEISSLKRFKDDASDVKSGFECGATILGYNDIHESDIIEAYEIKEEVK